MTTKNWFRSQWHEESSTPNVLGKSNNREELEADLARTWKRALDTKLGKEFSNSPEFPANIKLRFGMTNGPRAIYDEWRGNPTITVRKGKFKKHGGPYWQQVLLMEAGNAANRGEVKDLRERAVEGNVSRDEFIKGIEQIEFSSRARVVSAYIESQFCAYGAAGCKSAFESEKISFDEYFNHSNLVGHKAKIGATWDVDFKVLYEEKHGK